MFLESLIAYILASVLAQYPQPPALADRGNIVETVAVDQGGGDIDSGSQIVLKPVKITQPRESLSLELTAAAMRLLIEIPERFCFPRILMSNVPSRVLRN